MDEINQRWDKQQMLWFTQCQFWPVGGEGDPLWFWMTDDSQFLKIHFLVQYFHEVHKVLF